MKIFVHMPCAFNAFYGCLRTSSFQCRLLHRKKKKNSIEAATKLKKRNVTNFCRSIIVPQGKFLSFLTLNLSLFIFVLFCVRELWIEGRGGGKRKREKSCFFFLHREHGGCLWLCEAQAKNFLCTFFQPSRNRILPFYKGSFLPYSKGIDDVCVFFTWKKVKVLTDVLFLKTSTGESEKSWFRLD